MSKRSELDHTHNHDHGVDLESAVLDRAIGCLMGQAVGDALGTRYEFKGSAAVMEQIERDRDQAGHLPILGEGPFRLVPGQVTDDTELALGLARSLVRENAFDVNAIAQAYAVWMKSPPFDCGITTRNAFGLTNPRVNKPAENYAIIKKSAAKSNQKSQSNGCLMRISPLAIAGVRWTDPNNLVLAAQLECELTNPNPITKDATSTFTMAIRTAILTGDRDQVYEMALQTAQTPQVQDLLIAASERVEPIILSTGEKIKTESAQYMGYFGIAFQNAFNELLYGKSFEQSLVDVVSRGGDTDTNGCIAGTLLGALYGFKQIPADWYQTVTEAPTEERQEEYPYSKTSDLIELAVELLGEPDHHILEPQFAVDSDSDSDSDD